MHTTGFAPARVGSRVGAGGFAIRANVGVKADVESMFAAVLERFGRLDAVLSQTQALPATDITEEGAAS